MVEIMTLTDDNIDESIRNAGLPVFIDLWAEWCVPCRKVAPIIEELATTYEGKMIFSKLDIDHNSKTAEKYQIMSIPMFLIFNNDMSVLEKFIGAIPKQKFIDRIESALKKV